jgi:hypothetical protein
VVSEPVELTHAEALDLVARCERFGGFSCPPHMLADVLAGIHGVVKALQLAGWQLTRPPTALQ